MFSRSKSRPLDLTRPPTLPTAFTMSKLALSISLSIGLSMAACSSKPEPSPAPAAENLQNPSASAEPAAAPTDPYAPSALRERAKTLFQPLPEVFENPKNVISDEKIALGRQLYYEKRLSKGQDVACATCHDLAAFGVDSRDGGTDKVSKGHKGLVGTRNSPTSYNSAIQFVQFWDGRAADVEEQAKGPLVNPVEMALPDLDAAVTVIRSIPSYKPLFAAAFPGEAEPINIDNLAKAIGAFERKLSTKDRFDQFLKGDDSALNEAERKGLVAFLDTGCIACHTGPGLGGHLYQKLGLLKPYPTTDHGRYDVSKVETDKFMFKVPTLRNIEKTAPYFHDGSLATLDEAVQAMAEYQTAKGKLSAEDTASIVAFLKSLTGQFDAEYIKEPAELPAGPTTPKPDQS